MGSSEELESFAIAKSCAPPILPLIIWLFNPFDCIFSLSSWMEGRLFSIALRIPIAHDFRVISARKWARARTHNEGNLTSTKFDSEINVRFLLNEHGDLYFIA